MYPKYIPVAVLRAPSCKPEGRYDRHFIPANEFKNARASRAALIQKIHSALMPLALMTSPQRG